MPNLSRAPTLPPFSCTHRAPLSRRIIVALPVALAALLFSSGCGGAPPPAAPEPPGMAEMAPPAAAPAAAGPPASPPPSTGYAPPSAPNDAVDQPASFAAEVAPSEAPRPVTPAPAGNAPRPAARAPQPGRPPSPAKAAPPPPKAPTTAPAKTVDAKPPPNAAQPPATPVAPLLIYVGDIQMLVADEAAIPTTIDKVIDVAESLGGYLAGRKDTSVQVRIPSMRFREGFTLIEKMGEVTHRSVTADDVSEQYSDLEVRLQNLKATQKRLQEFLAKASTIQDMLTVGRELERVAGEIEAIEGKMRFLRSRAAFSLVTVGLQAKPKATVIAKNDTPPPPRAIRLPIDWLPRVGLDTLLNLN